MYQKQGLSPEHVLEIFNALPEEQLARAIVNCAKEVMTDQQFDEFMIRMIQACDLIKAKMEISHDQS